MSEDKPTKYSSVELEYYELYEQNRILKQNNILLSMKEEELKRQMNKYKDAVIQVTFT